MTYCTADRYKGRDNVDPADMKKLSDEYEEQHKEKDKDGVLKPIKTVDHS